MIQLVTPHILEGLSFIGLVFIGFTANAVTLHSFDEVELFGELNPLRLSRYLSKRKTALIGNKYSASVKSYALHLCCFYSVILLQLFFLPFSYETNSSILFFVNAPVVLVLTVIVSSDLAVLNLMKKANQKDLSEFLKLILNDDDKNKIVELMKENPKNYFTMLDLALYAKHVKCFQPKVLNEFDNYKL